MLSEKGAPTPVAWTRMRAPESLMAPAPDATVDGIVAASPLQKYAAVVDPQSAYEMLTARLQTARRPRPATPPRRRRRPPHRPPPPRAPRGRRRSRR